jgi:hypothetical protein
LDCLGAAHAGVNIKRPLLFNLLALTKYFHILVYKTDNFTVSSERKSITVDHFRKYSPTDDHKLTTTTTEAGIMDPISGRPVLGIRRAATKVNNVFLPIHLFGG